MFNKHLETIVQLALAEDVGPGDLTTALTIDPLVQTEGRIIAKQDLIVSGLLPCRHTFKTVDPDITFTAEAADGDKASSGQILVRLNGPAASILTAERVALNFLMRLSGVATITGKFVAAIGDRKAKIIDTRKTTPGMRALEKAAVRHGGGGNHRFALYDGILIKDNHIAAAGSITAAVSRAKNGAPHTMKVEVEVESLDGLDEAIAAGADAVLLDNMDLEQMTRASARAQGRVLLEASGGVDLSSVAQIAATGVDLISSGALTHSAPAVDISLKLE